MQYLLPKVRSTVFLIAIIALASPLDAQRVATQKRGLSSGQAFQISELDHINLFNGALTLTLPIGSEYPVGPDFSYRLLLAYNHFGWDFEVCPNTNPQVFNHIPDDKYNAGFGWIFTLGELEPQQPFADPDGWTYTSPDGAEHGLYDTLHPGTTAEANVFYSRDSQYTRLRPYRTDHTWSSGALATSTAFDPCDGTAFLGLADNTIDTSTGLVSESRDAAGVSTSFVYDELGRLVAERPLESGWTTIEYHPPTIAEPTIEAKVTTRTCGNGRVTCTNAAALAWERLHVRGRLITVCEDRATAWAGTCDGLLTRYTYDVTDQLKRVCVNADGMSCGQARNFVYDGRGFLTSETHPELGPVGNGTLEAWGRHPEQKRLLEK